MGKSNLTRRQHFADQLPKRHYESSLRSAVDKDCIQKIIARLHKINLSGRYNYSDLDEKIGRFHEDQQNNWLKDSKGEIRYDKKYVKKFPNFDISIFVNPKKPFLPHCYVQINPMKDISISTHKEFLIQFVKWFPDLQTSRVEYALDIFYFPDAISITNFYYNIRRHLYVPYQKKVRTMGGIKEKFGKKFEMNLVSRFGDDHKAYERGPDKLKNPDDYWMETDLDRVRLEYTADRNSLLKNEISSLSDLIKNPKFFQMNIGRWRFQQFKKSSKNLPSPWEPFTALDESGFSGSFQIEYIQARKDGIVKNLGQTREDVMAFSKIVYDMAITMKDFDDLWWAT